VNDDLRKPGESPALKGVVVGAEGKRISFGDKKERESKVKGGDGDAGTHHA